MPAGGSHSPSAPLARLAWRAESTHSASVAALSNHSGGCGSRGSAFVRCGRRRFGHPLCWRVRVSCPLFPLLDCRRVVGVLRLLPSAVVCFLSCFGGAACAVVARSRLCARRFGGGAPRCACGLFRFPSPPHAPSDAPLWRRGRPFLYPSQSWEPHIPRLRRVSGAKSTGFQNSTSRLMRRWAARGFQFWKALRFSHRSH